MNWTAYLPHLVVMTKADRVSSVRENIQCVYQCKKEVSGVKFLQLTTDALWRTMTHTHSPLCSNGNSRNKIPPVCHPCQYEVSHYIILLYATDMTNSSCTVMNRIIYTLWLWESLSDEQLTLWKHNRYVVSHIIRVEPPPITSHRLFYPHRICYVVSPSVCKMRVTSLIADAFHSDIASLPMMFIFNYTLQPFKAYCAIRR
jgi:hypothetical protein